MDFETWRNAILEELKEMSDRDFQRKAWNAEIPNEIHSFDDLISHLYDDFDFEGFIAKVQDNSSDGDAGSVLGQFNSRLSKYVDGLAYDVDDLAIIDDPEWIRLSDEAGRLLDVIKRLRGW